MLTEKQEGETEFLGFLNKTWFMPISQVWRYQTMPQDSSKSPDSLFKGI